MAVISFSVVVCMGDPQIGGTLSNRKGVNTPSVVLPISPLTKKDRAGEWWLSVCAL